MKVQIFKIVNVLANYVSFAFYILACLTIVYIGLEGNASNFNDKQEVWFQRSGSLLVLISLFVELNYLRHSEALENKIDHLADSITPRGGVNIGGRVFSTESKLDKALKAFQREPVQKEIESLENYGANFRKYSTWLTHTILIAGTLIWGYGDLVYLYFKDL